MNMMRDSNHPIYSSSRVQKTTISISMCHFLTFDYFILYSMISLLCISPVSRRQSEFISLWISEERKCHLNFLFFTCFFFILQFVNACVFTMCMSVICFFFWLFSLSFWKSLCIICTANKEQKRFDSFSSVMCFRITNKKK